MPIQQSEQHMKLLEVQNVKLNEVKNNLRYNRRKVQNDIREAIHTMIVSLRERERQLMDDLDNVFYPKDDKIVNQMELVAEEMAALNLGVPISHSILNVDDDVRLELDLPISDIKAMHERILQLGEIRVSQNCQRLPLKKVGRTLPLDMEAYDDDNMWLLTKKSKTDVTPDTPHEVDTVKNWLSRLPDGNAALNYDLSAFAVADSKSESSESTTSSFELLNEISTPFTANADRAFREKIDVIYSEPSEKWLLKGSSSEVHLPKAPVPESFRVDDKEEDDDEEEEEVEDQMEVIRAQEEIHRRLSQLHSVMTQMTAPQFYNDDIAEKYRHFLQNHYE